MVDLLMGWSKSQKRWFKKYRGKMYAVSPRTLGTEPTKEASRLAANRWWEKKQAEIDKALGDAKRHPADLTWAYTHAIEQWTLYAKWHRLQSNIDDAVKAENTIEFIKAQLKQDNPPFPLPKRLDDPLWPIVRDLPPEEETEVRLLWFDRLHTIQVLEQKENTSTATDNTIRSHIDAYLLLRKAQAEARDNIATYKTDVEWLDCFKEWVSPTASLDTIDDKLWEQFFVYLSGKVKAGDYTPTTMKHYQGAARAFILNRDEARLLDKPRNLTSRTLSLPVPLKQHIAYTVDEIKKLLSLATPRQSLYVLLALNCGMYVSDIGLLRQDEIDWKTGRLKRQRSKTRERSEKVPFVDYPLWFRTFDLLKKYRSDHQTLAILSERGEQLYKREKRHNNSIRTAYLRLITKAKIDKSWKALRKAGATLLETGQWGRFSEHYLGEVPRTVASRHYVHQNGAEFDNAIRWLGTTLGID